MSTINYSDVTGPILNGFTRDRVNLHDGYILNEVVGYAKITSTPQTDIPILIPSNAQAAGELVTNPDRRLVLPVGAIVTRIGLRLPQVNNSGNSRGNTTQQFGSVPIGKTLVGTTGDLVKVGSQGVFTTTDPSIAAVSGAYPLDGGATIQRPFGTADAGLLATVTAATALSLLVSNAGSTAAGAGISTSGGVALAIVQVCWYEPQPAIRYYEMGFQSSQKGI